MTAMRVGPTPPSLKSGSGVKAQELPLSLSLVILILQHTVIPQLGIDLWPTSDLLHLGAVLSCFGLDDDWDILCRSWSRGFGSSSRLVDDWEIPTALDGSTLVFQAETETPIEFRRRQNEVGRAYLDLGTTGPESTD
ncbi:hypothetical protein K474DRAFT_1676848 [Panus rudis PR-1116 ss-1]|nr:hypothetical protein K474DRAFT_1676848 [Panus rudis PR-1116 ss-1]